MSSTPTRPPSNKPPATPALKPNDFKALLRHLEAAGGVAVDLKALCDEHEDDLGAPGSDLRRAVQKQHDKCKNKWSAVKYLETLKDNHIVPSETTERNAFVEKLEKQKKTQKMDDTGTGETTNPSKSDDDGTNSDATNGGDTGDNGGVFNIIAGLENLSVEEPESVTPPRIVRTSSGRTPLPSSAGRRTPPPAVAIANSVGKGNGTKDNPFTLVYDQEYPERSFPFIIKFQPSIVVNDDEDGEDGESYEHKCFDIEKVEQALDSDDWEATIPNQIHTLGKRVVDIKGPSTSFFLRYQEDNDDKEHSALLQAIEQDESRKWLYWRIIFPSKTLLNNDILSKGRRLFKDHKPITIKKNHEKNEYEKDFHAILLHWRIALEGGRPIKTHSKKNKKKDFFK